jgi:hypothetical protein
MSTTKTKNPPAGDANASASTEPNFRVNPELEAKIDDWIKENPKDWKYITSMPIDRLRRTLVLNDIRKTEARERIDEETLNAVKNDPKRKQLYENLTEGMTEEQRDRFIIRSERDKRLAMQAQNQSRTQSRKEGVSV